MSAEQGKLTRLMLEDAMDLYYDNGDCIPESIGATWIAENPASFGEILCEERGERRGQVVSEFLRAHFDTPHVIEVLLCNGDGVLRELSHLKSEFVRDAFIHCGARNNNWIRVAREIEIPDEIVRGAILERLRQTKLVEPLSINEATDFVEYGAGMIVRPRGGDFLDVSNWRFTDTNAPWALFPGDTLLEPLLLCAEKAPTQTLQNARTIAARLGGWFHAMPILTEAMKHAHTVRHVDLRVLEVLHGPSLRFAQRMQYDPLREDPAHTARFMVQIYRRLDRHDTPWSFFEKTMRPILDQISAAVLYRHLHAPDLDARLWDYVNHRLKEDGWIVGNVRLETHRGRMQCVLDFGSVKYVHDSFGHRFFPRQGELVAVRKDSATPLTEGRMRVLRGHFTPLTRSPE